MKEKGDSVTFVVIVLFSHWHAWLVEQQDEHMLISDWNTQGCVRGLNVAVLIRKVKSRVWSQSARLSVLQLWT